MPSGIIVSKAAIIWIKASRYSFMARRLRIDLADLELAFESSDAECSYYLDLDSGEVLFVTDEMRSAFEELSEAAEIRDIEFTEALAESGLADWMKDAVAQVAVVEERFGTTVIDVPTDESSAAFRDMEAFAASVGDVQDTSTAHWCSFRRTSLSPVQGCHRHV